MPLSNFQRPISIHLSVSGMVFGANALIMCGCTAGKHCPSHCSYAGTPLDGDPTKLTVLFSAGPDWQHSLHDNTATVCGSLQQ